MRLADFLLLNIEPILTEWETFARSLRAGHRLDAVALRDHAGQILQATVRDMQSPQTVEQRRQKSKGLWDSGQESNALDSASDMHAVDRLSLGFGMMEVMSEYRALRASVLGLWHASQPGPDDRDVDDLTRFNESIDQSLGKAVASYTRRVDQARDMFLGILSHDLRNPLNAIAMTAQLVPEITGNPAEALECSHQITRSVSVMERMIRDLLDYTRTRLGAGMPVKPVALDLATICNELVTEFRVAYPGRAFELRDNGDLNGRWDSDRIRQAISNLLGNAVQHGAQDVPIILSVGGTPSEVFVEIHNGGDPIPPGELSKIFDPLVRGSSAADPGKSRPSGIGMGLYIAREVAKSHGGRIDVTSTAKDGTSFVLRLPRTSLATGQGILDADQVQKM